MNRNDIARLASIALAVAILGSWLIGVACRFLGLHHSWAHAFVDATVLYVLALGGLLVAAATARAR